MIEQQLSIFDLLAPSDPPPASKSSACAYHLQADAQVYGEHNSFITFGNCVDILDPSRFTLSADYLLDRFPLFRCYLSRPGQVDPREIVRLHGLLIVDEQSRKGDDTVLLIDGKTLVHRAPVRLGEIPASLLLQAFQRRESI